MGQDVPFLSSLTTQFPTEGSLQAEQCYHTGNQQLQTTQAQQVFQGIPAFKIKQISPAWLSPNQTPLESTSGRQSHYLFCFPDPFLGKEQAAGQLLLQIPRTLPQALQAPQLLAYTSKPWPFISLSSQACSQLCCNHWIRENGEVRKASTPFHQNESSPFSTILQLKIYPLYSRRVCLKLLRGQTQDTELFCTLCTDSHQYHIKAHLLLHPSLTFH